MTNNMYGMAEKYLYRYQSLKAKQARCAEEIMQDAAYAAYGQATRGDRVKSSNISNPTLNGGIRVATSKECVLTPTERMWIEAIESAWAELLVYDPPKARLMEVVYGLVGKGAANRAQRAYIRDEVMGELCLDRIKTFYDWKSECVHTVICHALASKIRAG